MNEVGVGHAVRNFWLQIESGSGPSGILLYGMEARQAFWGFVVDELRVGKALRECW